MSETAIPVPSWKDALVRAAIYAAVAFAISFWSIEVAIVMAAFMVINLIHHAADTVRRKSGYVPIPYHPSNPDASKTPLKVTGRALLIVFGLVWLAAAVSGHWLLETTWLEALGQSLAVAGFAAVMSALMFPIAVIALFWVLSVTLGLLLSLADLAAITLISPDNRKSWHRKVDSMDHNLANVVLGQRAMIPLRADLAERAAEDAQDAKRHA